MALFTAVGASLLAGCMSSYHYEHTIEIVDRRQKIYALKVEGSSGVTFQVPDDWTLSHWPEGGLAGISDFSNEKKFGAHLTVDGEIQPGVTSMTSQESLQADEITRDEQGEQERLDQDAKDLEQYTHSPSVTVRPRRPNDHATVELVTERKTPDGDLIRIYRWQSPLRGTWFQALIPTPGFVVRIILFPEFDEGSSHDDVATISRVVDSYRRSPDREEKSTRTR